VVLLKRRSEGGINNFVTEDVSVIKESVARGGQVLLKRRSTECVKLSLAAPRKSVRIASRELEIPEPTVRKFYGHDCSFSKYSDNLYAPCILRSTEVLSTITLSIHIWTLANTSECSGNYIDTEIISIQKLYRYRNYIGTEIISIQKLYLSSSLTLEFTTFCP
jgi:hypothetical protein